MMLSLFSLFRYFCCLDKLQGNLVSEDGIVLKVPQIALSTDLAHGKSSSESL